MASDEEIREKLRKIWGTLKTAKTTDEIMEDIDESKESDFNFKKKNKK